MNKLLSSRHFSRDHSPISGMRGIFHRGDNNQNKKRSKETETEKTGSKMMDEEVVGMGRPSDREGRDKCQPLRVREGERDWRDGDRRPADGRSKHSRPLSSVERIKIEQDVKKGNKKGDTFPRERKMDNESGMIKMGEVGGKGQRDQPRREPNEDREMERFRRQERETQEIQRRATEDVRRLRENMRTQQRERYKMSGVAYQDRTVEGYDSWDRRDRDAGRKEEHQRAVLDMRESDRYSTQRPEREVYTERSERTPKRDARCEGNNERELEKGERMRDGDDSSPFSRDKVFYKSRRARGRNRDGHQERCREERYKGREIDDRGKHRDDRTDMRTEDSDRDRCRSTDGRKDHDQYRNPKEERERNKRQEDGRGARSNRSLSDCSPRGSPRAQRRGQWSSEGDNEMRYIPDFEREQRKEISVVKESQIDPDQRSQRQLARGERIDRDETTSCGSDKAQMWLEPQTGKKARQKEGRWAEQSDMKSQAEAERDVRHIREDTEKYLERREYSEGSEGLSKDGDDEEEICRESQGKEPLSDSGGGTEVIWIRNTPGEILVNNTSDTEEDGGSDSGSRGGSDSSWNPDRDRLQYSEYGNVVLSGSNNESDMREQELRKHEKFNQHGNSSKTKEEVINTEPSGRERKIIVGTVAQTSSQSESSEMSLSQDKEKGVAETNDANIKDHHQSSDEEKRKPQHEVLPTPSRRDEQPLTDNQDTGNGPGIPRVESFTSGDPSEEDDYAEPVDLQDKEVEEIMTNDLLSTKTKGTKRDSKTKRLLEEWRKKNGEGNQTSSGICDNMSQISLEKIQPLLNEMNIEAMSPEEIEAIRNEMSGTWSDPDATKRRSQAPHLKWAKSVVRTILGNSGEQLEDEPNSEVEQSHHVEQTDNNRHPEEAEKKSVNLPILKLPSDDQHSEPELEEEEEGDDLDYKVDEMGSQSWSEANLKNAFNSIGRLKRKSSFYNRPQLYQQYNEETQNFEILRQSRSDNLSVGERNSRSPLPSPPPAQRPLPPLPQAQHNPSMSSGGSLNCPQTLSIPEHPRAERRASSPSLSASLKQSSLLWRDLPNVRNNLKLDMVTEDERRLQEVRFEVVTSEASYCRSLDIVVEHFVKCKDLEKLLTTQDKNWLFSRLTEVRVISHRFLSKLEERVESDVLHFTVCDIIARQCQRFRKVYVPYLTNQSYQDATYQRLMNDNPNFKRIVDHLERSSVCQRLPLRSFLVLPFQRITRIKLLVQNILKRTTPGTLDAENTVKALRRLERIIQESNDSITEMKTIESLVSLSGKVEFVDCKTLPLISQKRRLVREGPITELMDFSLKQTERTIYLHLFNDYLLVSLQKEGGRFTVIDHCPVEELRTEDFRVKILTVQRNSFRLHISNRSLLLRTETQSDKLRWISALSPKSPVIDFSAAEKSAQMQCIRAYVAQQPDEMSLEKADVILVHQDSTDNKPIESWVDGTRLSDLHHGWVPKSHLKVIINDTVKKRNLSDALTLTNAKAAV